ncbi:MAG TPA: polyhydroxyalkanoate synthesis regulator DNA-binding domain-containing protein [Xanthobacteraceae bacterium]|nr:polyhydroxyalkanoate synthesis regulator DNA-binding domain-containing protein [Xanthobacteraceae bacterium]
MLKRYGGSRFYDTVALRYVTVSDPREWADNDVRFVVVDADSGDYVTRMLLA